MGRQDGVKGIRHKEVCVFRIGRIHVYYSVKAQVRDLRYNSSNLCSNYIIRHMLTKWTYNPTGICGWGIRMALKGLGIRKCVSSRIGFMHVYHSMYFHYLLLYVDRKSVV